MVTKDGQHPYIVRMSSNNGQKGLINEDEKFLNEGNTISFGQDTATMFYQESPYFTGDKIKIVKAKDTRFSKANAQFFISTMARAFSTFSWGSSSFNVNILKNQNITLPINKKGEVDFEFMERFISNLESNTIAQLKNYLVANDLTCYDLTEDEVKSIENYETLEWGVFNVEELFGKSTRGRRLKSEDRIAGNLPFVTAGETDEGVSAFIGNNVKIFPKNTITIDMFGSAKYRNYEYGGDDHIAVVHAETLPKFASVFLTSALHKSSYNGQFNYGRNFYAKDADVLNISLPIKGKNPDFEIMETIVSAIHKLVIKKLVLYVNRKAN